MRGFLLVMLAALLGLIEGAAVSQSAPPQGSGPYPATREEDPGLPGFTIYRPARPRCEPGSADRRVG